MIYSIKQKLTESGGARAALTIVTKQVKKQNNDELAKLHVVHPENNLALPRYCNYTDKEKLNDQINYFMISIRLITAQKARGLLAAILLPRGHKLGSTEGAYPSSPISLSRKLASRWEPKLEETQAILP